VVIADPVLKLPHEVNFCYKLPLPSTHGHQMRSSCYVLGNTGGYIRFCVSRRTLCY